MKQRERLWPLAGMIAAHLACATVAAADKPRAAAPAASDAEALAADDELLEFLGSVGADADDGDWLDYLSSTDIQKIAKAAPARSGAKK